jgi:dCTP deaminase
MTKSTIVTKTNKRNMLLSSSAIRARIADKTLDIIPFSEISLQPASYDLRIADDAVMTAGELSLIATMEFVSLPTDLAATLRVRSSFGRRGVLLGAGYIDPGFRGNLTLCLVNMGLVDISVEKGTRIVQMLIHPILGDVESAYNGRYQDSRGVVQSKI